MSDEPISLSAYRAEKAGDCRLWTARDALVYLLNEIDSGNVNPSQMMIHYLQGDPEEGMKYDCVIAGLGRSQHIALLALAQMKAVKEWAGE